MKKKVLALLLAAATCISMLGGCGQQESSTSSTEGAGSAEAGSVAAEGEEPFEVAMTYMYFGTLPADLQMVEDAINEIAIAETNTKVRLVPFTMQECMTQQTLMISSNDKLDLMIGFQQSGFQEIVNKKMAIPLDDLYAQYGAAIAEAQGPAIAGGYLDGTLWGISSTEKMAKTYGLCFDKAILDKYGFTKTEDVTYEELDELFAQIKAGEGDGFYPMALNGTTLTTYEYFHRTDYLGASIASGGIRDNGYAGSTIENIFATEEYMEHCKWMRKWYEAGYINRDAVTTTEQSPDIVRTNKAACYPLPIELDMVSGQEAGVGRPMQGVSIAGKMANTGLYQGQCWMISSTCENPEATFRFLNLLYENEDVINLLYHGIEGTHYVKTDDPSGRIVTFPEGLDAQSVGYANWLGLYGAIGKRYERVPLTGDYFTTRDEYNSSMTADEQSPYLGYAFNTEPVKTEFVAVNDVITQYRASLESGSVDPEETIPKMVEALEAAGIDKIIAANQANLDTWIAAQN